MISRHRSGAGCASGDLSGYHILHLPGEGMYARGIPTGSAFLSVVSGGGLIVTVVAPEVVQEERTVMNNKTIIGQADNFIMSPFY